MRSYEVLEGSSNSYNHKISQLQLIINDQNESISKFQNDNNLLKNEILKKDLNLNELN